MGRSLSEDPPLNTDTREDIKALKRAVCKSEGLPVHRPVRPYVLRHFGESLAGPAAGWKLPVRAYRSLFASDCSSDVQTEARVKGVPHQRAGVLITCNMSTAPTSASCAHEVCLSALQPSADACPPISGNLARPASYQEFLWRKERVENRSWGLSWTVSCA